MYAAASPPDAAAGAQRQTRCTPAAIRPVTASMATACSSTATMACDSASNAMASPADASPTQKGINAGTSARPAPCAVDITKDPSAQPV